VPRQRTMRATLDWSVDALSPSQHALFRYVGIFADGWTLDSAAGICGDKDDESFDVLERLSSLVETSLVVVDTSRIRTRYRLLESTRLYALEQLDACGERRDVAARHASYFASFCDKAREAVQTTQFAAWLARVSEELENVRSALAWALGDDGDPAIALRLANGLGPFWLYAGLSQEGRRWFEAALARGGDGVDPQIVACAWRNLASLKRGAESLEAAERAVALDECAGDAFAIAQSRQIRALSLIYVGRLTEAEADINHAILLLRDLGMLGTIAHARALNAHAFALAEQGRLDEARRALEASLGVYTDRGDELHVAIVQSNLAELAFYAGDVQQALRVARTAGIAWSQVGNFAGQSMMLADEAAYCLALGNMLGASEAAKHSLVLARRGQLVDVLFSALQHLAAVAALNGDARSGALLIGYVNLRNRARGYQRELIERRTFDILMGALDATLSVEERDNLLVKGEELDEEAAVELALRIS
jgi:tetratricopeptide (TPR) repeat protein